MGQAMAGQWTRDGEGRLKRLSGGGVPIWWGKAAAGAETGETEAEAETGKTEAEGEGEQQGCSR